MKVRRKKPERINLMIGTAGHVDHGKTALVKLLTGCDTDRLKEEKERGLSINLGFAPCYLAGRRMVGIVDVPGHEKFIRNMVAGVTGIDLCLLVVAADDGVMPQTREHLDILTLLGLRRGLVALTKIDLVDADTRELAQEEVRDFLRGTFLEDAPICPVSSVTGEGYDEFFETLVRVVEATPPRDVNGVFRLPVERTFSVRGYGTVATGIAASGTVRVGENLELLPQGRRVRVRGLQVFQVEEEQARGGECIALNVDGVEHREIERGNVFATPGYFRPADSLIARLHYLPSAPRPLAQGARIRFHTGTSEVYGEVHLLGTDELAPGESGLVHFRLEEPVVVGPKDRYILRQPSPPVTIGGGILLDEAPRRLRRMKASVIEGYLAREAALATPAAFVEYQIRQAGPHPVLPDEVARATKLTAAQLEEALAPLLEQGRVVKLSPGGRLVHADALVAARTALRERLSEFHARHPLREGMERLALRDAVGLDPLLFEEALRQLLEEKQVEVAYGHLRRVGHEVRLTDQQTALLADLEALFAHSPFATPRPDELAQHLPAPAEELAPLLALLCERGVLAALADDVIFHREAVAEAQARLVAYLREHGEILTTDYRDLLQTTKKYAVALLDHFAATGLTRRVESKHFLRATATAEMG